jgi:hypothetical protein
MHSSPTTWTARLAPIHTGADEFSTATVTRRPLTTADVGPNAP